MAFGIVVASLVASTKLQSTGMDDRLQAGTPYRYVSSQLGQLMVAKEYQP